MTLSPDNQRNDPYGWIVNQSGHAAIVGFGMALPFLWLPPIACVGLAALAYATFWEWGYQWVALGSRDWRDAVADTLNVAFGAALAAAVGPNPAFWAIWAGWLVGLAIGAWFRR